MPSYGGTPVEIWGKEYFKLEVVDSELALAEDLGFNAIRLFLCDVRQAGVMLGVDGQNPRIRLPFNTASVQGEENRFLLNNKSFLFLSLQS